MLARGKTFIKYAHAIFLLSGGSSSYREIHRGWSGSRIYVARATSSASAGRVHHSGDMRARYHNGIVHNLGAVLCSQGQTEGSRRIRIVVVCGSPLRYAASEIRGITRSIQESHKLWDAFSRNTDETCANNRVSFKIRSVSKINSYNTPLSAVDISRIFVHFRYLSPLRAPSISPLMESSGGN